MFSRGPTVVRRKRKAEKNQKRQDRCRLCDGKGRVRCHLHPVRDRWEAVINGIKYAVEAAKGNGKTAFSEGYGSTPAGTGDCPLCKSRDHGLPSHLPLTEDKR